MLELALQAIPPSPGQVENCGFHTKLLPLGSWGWLVHLFFAASNKIITTFFFFFPVGRSRCSAWS